MTDLKWSRFNFLVETEKHRKYLYNSYSNSLIALDDSLYASLLFYLGIMERQFCRHFPKRK